MARGWGSKSVESQIEEAGSTAASAKNSVPRMETAEIRCKREGLMLQRSRILQDMKSARNPRYRNMLDEILSCVELQLASLIGK
jgi:hypothetical protein